MEDEEEEEEGESEEEGEACEGGSAWSVKWRASLVLGVQPSGSSLEAAKLEAAKLEAEGRLGSVGCGGGDAFSASRSGTELQAKPVSCTTSSRSKTFSGRSWPCTAPHCPIALRKATMSSDSSRERSIVRTGRVYGVAVGDGARDLHKPLHGLALCERCAHSKLVKKLAAIAQQAYHVGSLALDVLLEDGVDILVQRGRWASDVCLVADFDGHHGLWAASGACHSRRAGPEGARAGGPHADMNG